MIGDTTTPVATDAATVVPFTGQQIYERFTSLHARTPWSDLPQKYRQSYEEFAARLGYVGERPDTLESQPNGRVANPCDAG